MINLSRSLDNRNNNVSSIYKPSTIPGATLSRKQSKIRNKRSTKMLSSVEPTWKSFFNKTKTTLARKRCKRWFKKRRMRKSCIIVGKRCCKSWRRISYKNTEALRNSIFAKRRRTNGKSSRQRSLSDSSRNKRWRFSKRCRIPFRGKNKPTKTSLKNLKLWKKGYRLETRTKRSH